MCRTLFSASGGLAPRWRGRSACAAGCRRRSLSRTPDATQWFTRGAAMRGSDASLAYRESTRGAMVHELVRHGGTGVLCETDEVRAPSLSHEKCARLATARALLTAIDSCRARLAWHGVTPVPPWRTSSCTIAPASGFPDTPENASDPPHCSATRKPLSGSGVRLRLRRRATSCAPALRPRPTRPRDPRGC